MHIGLLSPAWPVNLLSNGIVTYVHNLRLELINQGHRVSVFSRHIEQENKDAGIYLIEADAKFRIGMKFLKLVQGKRTDMDVWGSLIAQSLMKVHCRDPIDLFEMEESFGWCAVVQERITIPVVVKLHGPAFLDLVEDTRDTDYGRTKIDIEGRALACMPAITSPAQATLRDAVARYGLKPKLQKVILNPMQSESGLELWDVSRCNPKTILFVGRFDKRKGGDTVLLAFKKLLERDDNLKLIFIGVDNGIAMSDGTRLGFDAYSRTLFTEEQLHKISYLGQLPRTELAQYRRKAMLSLVVSRWENQPNTALEAMLQGCPVVATAVGGMSEIIEHGVTGLLVRPNDIVDLCEKMASLLSDPVRARQLGENARRFVIKQFSGEKLATETVDFYGKVISMAQARIT